MVHLLTLSVGQQVRTLEPRMLPLCVGLQVPPWNEFTHSLTTDLPPTISSPSVHSPLTATICSLPAVEFTADFFVSLPFIMQSPRSHLKSITMFCRTNLLLINRLLRLCFVESCPGSIASKQGMTTLEEWSLAAVTLGLCDILNRTRVLILVCVPSRDSKAS